MTRAHRGARARVALATSADWPALPPDDQVIEPALDRVGIDAAIAVWTDDDVDWGQFDAILVRSCWNYHEDLPRWLGWISEIERRAGAPGARVQLLNSPSHLRWNARKTYLIDLAARGVPIVPTRWLDAKDLRSWTAVADALQACGWDELIVKPAVSAGARFTYRLRRADLGACQAALEPALIDLARRGPVLVQPYLHEIAVDGEWSLLFFDGVLSHAVLKRPAAGDFRVQERHGGTAIVAAPPDELRVFSQQVLAAATEVCRAAAIAAGDRVASAPLLYARVDLVVSAGRPLLMELEITEPALFLTIGAIAPGGEAPADRLAAAIARRLERASM